MEKELSTKEWLELMPDYKTDTQRCLDWMFGVGEFENIKIPPYNPEDESHIEKERTGGA